MTRAQFEEARQNAVARYMIKAAADMHRGTKTSQLNAESRYNLCAKLQILWDLDGFWTPENENAYTMIYKDLNDLTAVSPF